MLAGGEGFSHGLTLKACVTNVALIDRLHLTFTHTHRHIFRHHNGCTLKDVAIKRLRERV